MNTVDNLDQEVERIQTQIIDASIDRTSKKSTVKKLQLTGVNQKQILVDMLLPQSKIRGKTVLVSIPTGTHYLIPPKGEIDIAREWANDQFYQLYGRTPTNQAYKAACTAITVSLRSLAMQELQQQSFEESSSQFKDFDDSLPIFQSKERVDGHDNLYIFDGCRIGRLKKKDKEGEEYSSILWDRDVFPIVHKVYTVHDTYEGQQTQYDVTIAGIRKILPLETFKNGNWYDYFPGVTGVLDNSKEKMYKAVLMQCAKAAPKIAAFETTGWHKITDGNSDEWIYLFPDGRFLIRDGIDASKYDVKLINDLLGEQEKLLWKTFQILGTLPSVQIQQAAYDHLKKITSHGQALILLAHNIGSLLFDFRDATFGPGFSAYITAPGGAGKTSLACFCRCIAAPYALNPQADVSFDLATASAIEARLTFRSSTPVVVDDIVDQRAKHTENGTKVNALSRAVFNRDPVRRRMTVKMKAQRANHIRTLPVFTAEYIPSVPDVPKSWYRRVLILGLEHGELIKDDCMREYAHVLQSWGYEIIKRFQNDLARDGYDATVKKLEKIYTQARAKVREAIVRRWTEEQPNSSLPGDWDSIGDSAAYILLYFHIFCKIAAPAIQASIEDIFSHLINTVYQQILRMEGRIADEEGLFPFEKALLSLFEDIKSGKIENSQRWRIDHKVPASGPIEPPRVWTEGKKYKFPPEFWGWTPEMRSADDNADCPRVPNFCIVAYIDDTTIYLTDRARKELLKIISKLPGGEGITSDKALGELAEKEGWITKRQDSRQRSFKIVPPQGVTWVWALSFEKFLAHYQDIPDSELVSDSERPDNVHDFPAKDHNPNNNDEDYDPFADENVFL